MKPKASTISTTILLTLSTDNKDKIISNPTGKDVFLLLLCDRAAAADWNMCAAMSKTRKISPTNQLRVFPNTLSFLLVMLHCIEMARKLH